MLLVQTDTNTYHYHLAAAAPAGERTLRTALPSLSPRTLTRSRTAQPPASLTLLSLVLVQQAQQQAQQGTHHSVRLTDV